MLSRRVIACASLVALVPLSHLGGATPPPEVARLEMMHVTVRCSTGKPKRSLDGVYLGISSSRNDMQYLFMSPGSDIPRASPMAADLALLRKFKACHIVKMVSGYSGYVDLKCDAERILLKSTPRRTYAKGSFGEIEVMPRSSNIGFTKSEVSTTPDDRTSCEGAR